MLSGSSSRKKISSSKAGPTKKLNKTLDVSNSEKKTSNKIILKQRILFPKKHSSKEKLGTSTSMSEEDQQRSPGETPGEASVVNFEESGSEYIPSDGNQLLSLEFYYCTYFYRFCEPHLFNFGLSNFVDDGSSHLSSPAKRRSSSSNTFQKAANGTVYPTPSKCKKDDRWAGGSLKRRKRKVELSPDNHPDDWQSDDSDWLCTDDEEISSDNDSSKKHRRCKLPFVT